jgi:hypothetical protein
MAAEPDDDHVEVWKTEAMPGFIRNIALNYLHYMYCIEIHPLVAPTMWALVLRSWLGYRLQGMGWDESKDGVGRLPEQLLFSGALDAATQGPVDMLTAMLLMAPGPFTEPPDQAATAGHGAPSFDFHADWLQRVNSFTIPRWFQMTQQALASVVPPHPLHRY